MQEKMLEPLPAVKVSFEWLVNLQGNIECLLRFMIHKHQSGCRRPGGGCSANYPKPCVERTHLDERGYVQYRRRGAENADVVEHNLDCLRYMDSHVNVQIAATANVISYLFKYFYKGRDKAEFAVHEEFGGGHGCSERAPEAERTKQRQAAHADELAHDEINQYLAARYVSATEAVWRILRLPTHSRSCNVFCLPVDLPGEDSVVFEDGGEDEALDSTPALERYLARPTGQTFDNLRYEEYFCLYHCETRKPSGTLGVNYWIDEHPTNPRFLELRCWPPQY